MRDLFVVMNEIGMGFTNILKVASTSIRVAILKRFPEAHPTDDPEDYYRDKWINREIVKRCCDRREFARRRDLYRFAVVRNPYERLVSCWAEKCRRPIEDRNCDGVLLQHAGQPFSEFITCICQEHDELMDPHYAPQALFLYDGSRPTTDAIVRVEALDDWWQRHMVSQLFEPLERIKVGEYGGWQSHYTEELRAMVRYRFALDFLVTGYQA